MREAGVAAAASQFPIPVFRLLLPPFHLCSGFRFLLRFPPSHLAFSFLFFRFLLLLSLLLTLSLHQRRLKASRAPQLRGAEEAPLSERSEFASLPSLRHKFKESLAASGAPFFAYLSLARQRK